MGTSPLHRPAYQKLRKVLLKLREEAELSQRALAKKLSKPHSYVAKVEHADRRIDPIEFINWCKACDKDPSEILKKLH